MGKTFKTKWVDEMTKSLKRLHPDKDEEQLREQLNKIYKDRVSNTECSLHNNYINKEFKTNLLDLIDWIEDTKPICAGYGTFYMNQDKVNNPNANMLLGFLTDRAKIKKQLKVLPQDSYEYAEADRAQNGKKRNANSFYGVNLSKVSAFYNKYTGVSITATGQSLLSTSMTGFESFVAGAFKLYGPNDFVSYVETCLKNPMPKEIEVREISKLELFDWLAPRMVNRSATTDEFVSSYIGTLSADERNTVFYKNNIFEAIKLAEVEDDIIWLLANTDNYRDAGAPPENIRERLQAFALKVMSLIDFHGFYFDRINRFKTEKRKAVVLCDTDSDMITIDRWVRYVRANLYVRAGKPDNNNTEFISISIMAYLMTTFITRVLDRYCRRSNVLERYIPRINMKNELLMPRIAIAATKKRYIALQKLREGKEFNPPRFDAKGIDFIKSTTRAATRKFMEDICKEDILTGDVKINQVRYKLKGLEKVIRTSLERGERDFLIPSSVKESEAYKKPYSTQGLMAVIAWNNFYPDDPIALPEIVDLVKVKLANKNVIEEFKNNDPERFAIFNEKYIHTMIPQMKDKFITAIAIPRKIDGIPDWIIPYIDYEAIINDNLARFSSVMESLDMVDMKVKGGNTVFSNILNI